MTSHEDKGILQIDYNFLNLPNSIKFDKTFVPRFPGLEIEYNVNTRYLYRADGTKLRKLYTFGSGRTNIETSTITEYLDGFQYEATDTGGRYFMIPKFVPTAEGYYNFENNKYIYNYTDHLGNVRLSYFNNGSSTEVLEESNYYPFGLKHEGYNPPGVSSSYNYKYNGKELQTESGMYDYGARFYMSDIGRWGVVDPLAEQMRRHSPYNYAFNNPIRFIDPDGMQNEDWRDKNGKKMSSDQLKNVKVYVFYNPNILDGFSDQTMQQYAAYEKKYGKGSVALSDAMTEKDFAQDWGDMEGKPSEIVMNHHGSNQQLHLNIDPDNNLKTLDGEYIVSTNNGKTNSSQTLGKKISDLPEPKADISKATLCLNTCNSNNPQAFPMSPGSTLAAGFSKDTGVGQVRGTNKKVNFNSSGQATTQWYYGGQWQYFKNGAQVERPNSPKIKFTVPRHTY